MIEWKDVCFVAARPLTLLTRCQIFSKFGQFKGSSFHSIILMLIRRMIEWKDVCFVAARPLTLLTRCQIFSKFGQNVKKPPLHAFYQWRIETEDFILRGTTLILQRRCCLVGRYGPLWALYPPGVTVRNRLRLLSQISACHSEASSDAFPNCFASTSSFLDVPGILLLLIKVLW